MSEIELPPQPVVPEIITDNAGFGLDVNIEDPEHTLYDMKKDGSLEKGVIDQSGKPIILPSSMGDMKYLLERVLSGDTKPLEDPKMSGKLAGLEIDKIKKALEYLAKSNNLTDKDKALLATEGWRMTFRAKPPTPEEFLTPKYIGDMANNLHPWIRGTFLKFFNPLAPYRNLVLSSCIGTGKSQPLDSKVYTSRNSYKLMKDIEAGDTVLSPDGSATEVIATKDWEPEDIYELEMDNGKTMKCGLHHLHHVSYRKDSNGNKIWDDVETQFILDNPDYEYEFQEVEVE